MQISQLPQSIARLVTRDGFVESYQEKLSTVKNCREAYEAAEEEYRILFGTPKYSTYDTFRNALARWNKNRIKRLKSRK